MSGLQYACCDERRHAELVGHPTLNAIDHIVVADLTPAQLPPDELAEYNALPADERDRLLWQRRLTVRFVNPLTPTHLAGLSAGTIEIRGGVRIPGIEIRGAQRVRRIEVAVLNTTSDSLVLRTSTAGDFSRYTLALVRSPTDLRPPPDFDPVYSEVAFWFKIDCPLDFDCRPVHECAEPEVAPPEIDYLAKDYSSFRRLILDRMALLAPDWRERSPADLGVALVEILAYIGDHLSYRQDAVATEAYIGTARRRTSVRRHAVLVDYALHDGCNARTWVHLEVSADTVVQSDNLRFFTHVPGVAERVTPGSRELQKAVDAGPEWFEPVAPSLDPDAQAAALDLFLDLNRLFFHTWGNERCCLPADGTCATVRGNHPELEEGMVLVFVEVKGPLTGEDADADLTRRHAVRLTSVVHAGDGGAPLTDPLDGSPITEIEWGTDDALPFPLCVSSRDETGAPVDDVTVALGNIVLVDHGRSASEPLGVVPRPFLFLVGDTDGVRCDVPAPKPVQPRFRPSLEARPLTLTPTVLVQVGTGDERRFERRRFDLNASAAAAFPDTKDVSPAIVVDSTLPTETTRWLPVRDLLNADETSPRFVVETEHDGSATLRFGDDEHGLRPRATEVFSAHYRVGNGAAGNVGADSILHVVTGDARIVAVRNPLPARGGTEPESIEQARRRAPHAFRRQERAVTAADYEEVAVRHPTLQRAAATFRWTGSWNTVFLTVDRLDGRSLKPELEEELIRHVDRFRMAGHDLELDEPRFVSLELELFVCVRPDYFRSDVKQRLLGVLTGRGRRDPRAVFHADNFTFGQTIYVSPILAAARAVAGVASANVVTFQRQGVPETRYLNDGRLPLGRLEIARLENDPNFPEHGVIRLELSGGK